MIAWLFAFVFFVVWMITKQEWSLMAAHIYNAAFLVIGSMRSRR